MRLRTCHRSGHRARPGAGLRIGLLVLLATLCVPPPALAQHPSWVLSVNPTMPFDERRERFTGRWAPAPTLNDFEHALRRRGGPDQFGATREELRAAFERGVEVLAILRRSAAPPPDVLMSANIGIYNPCVERDVTPDCRRPLRIDVHTSAVGPHGWSHFHAVANRWCTTPSAICSWHASAFGAKARGTFPAPDTLTELDGRPVHTSDDWSEVAVLLSRGDRPFYLPVTRERWLRTRIRLTREDSVTRHRDRIEYYEEQIAAIERRERELDEFGEDFPPGVMSPERIEELKRGIARQLAASRRAIEQGFREELPRRLARIHTNLVELERELAGLSPAERQAQAISDFGRRPLVEPNPALFHPSIPRYEIQTLRILGRRGKSSREGTAALHEALFPHIDWDALAALLVESASFGSLTRDVSFVGSFPSLPQAEPVTTPSDPADAGAVTLLLDRAREGDRDAFDRLYALVYDELRRIAHGQRLAWRGDYTMNTTALVHEAYLKLVRQDEPDWASRGHFFAVAATAMRHILVNYAERRRARKRGGDVHKVPLDEARDGGEFNPVPADAAEELIALDRALEKLGRENERQCRVVECRFFIGLPVDETARVLGISPATVKRDWKSASEWLYRELTGTA